MTAKITLLWLVVGLVAAGCGVGGQIGKGMKLYNQDRYDHAMKTWAEIEKKEGSMNEKGLIRYLVYRGLTHYKLGQRDLALRFLKRGKRQYITGDPDWLLPEIRDQMNSTLAVMMTKAPTTPASTAPKAPKVRPKPATTAGKIHSVKRGTVVAMFDIADPSKQLSKAELDQLHDYLGAQLTAKAGLKIVPRSQLRQRLAERKKDSLKRCYDESCQIELGRAVAAQKSLATKLLRVGDTCAITAVLYDLRTETAEGAATVDTRCSANALMAGMRQIASRFAGGR